MKHKLMNGALVLALTVAIALPVLAADTANVVVDLKGQKVVKGADSKEKFERADKANPGDIIEYKAVYRNTGKKTATNVLATIPAPLGTDYIPGSAKPADVSASLDGKEFAPVPLKRKVKLPSGKEELQDIPYQEYRFIRWDIKTLAPGKSSTVSLRVKISTEQPKTGVPAK
jgi:uncharacterized repeat protein (TIGR01451 family)